jgi:HTH-type transcriptional regulator / antitoxin HigA
MAEPRKSGFDWAVAPGEILQEALEERDLSQSELARRMDRPVKTVNEIVNGKAAITPDTAIQLELTLGIPASFWNNLESRYRAYLAQERAASSLEAQADWLTKFPLKDLARHKLIEPKSSKGETVAALLAYFQVGSPTAWENRWLTPEVEFRASKAHQSSPHAVSAWLRWGELLAEEAETKPFNDQTLREVLQGIRAMTRRDPTLVIRRVKKDLAEAGVALILAPEFEGTRLSGAIHWPRRDAAIIQLSFRHKSDDHFWFSLFHEAGHALDRRGRDFVDELARDVGEAGDDEGRADTFARNTLLEPVAYEEFVAADNFDRDAITAFAAEQKIAAGIVVGRLQYDDLLPPATHLNSLKKKVKWAAPLA